MIAAVVLVLAAYLLGAISFSYLIVRARHGLDVRNLGSGNAGATNVLRVSGLGAGLSVLALDVGKGAAAVAAVRWCGASGPVVGAAAVAVVVGHVYPVYYGFRGGKGVATATGAMSGLAPLAAALSALVFLIAVLATRYVSIGSIIAIGCFPLFLYLGGRFGWTPPAPPWLLVAALAVALLIVFLHLENVRRIRGGSEWKIGDPRGSREAG